MVRRDRGSLLPAEHALAVDDVHERVPALWDRLVQLGTRPHGEVHVHCGGPGVDRRPHAEGLAGDDPDLDAVLLGPADVLALQFLVPGLDHLVF
uniref:Pirin-like protein n=1 Tax=Arundo donax TaxID=35708 RepID=A0A0A8ZUH7_ARUDO